MSLEQMRKNYSMQGLDRQEVDPDPMVQFARWFDESNRSDMPDWVEANAMTLSTSDLAGHVTSRIVLLKGIESGKLLFFTNYESTKGQQLASNPQVSLGFHWPHLQRQVCIQGIATKTDSQQNETYFHSRPRESQLGAIASRQSAIIENREVLEQRMLELESKFADQTVPCPEHWGGYEVTPSRVELWQGRPSRLHDRISYRREGNNWIIERLSP